MSLPALPVSFWVFPAAGGYQPGGCHRGKARGIFSQGDLRPKFLRRLWCAPRSAEGRVGLGGARWAAQGHPRSVLPAAEPLGVRPDAVRGRRSDYQPCGVLEAWSQSGGYVRPACRRAPPQQLTRLIDPRSPQQQPQQQRRLSNLPHARAWQPQELQSRQLEERPQSQPQTCCIPFPFPFLRTS